MTTHDIKLTPWELTTIRKGLEKARLATLLAPGAPNHADAFNKAQEYDNVLQSLPVPKPDFTQDFLDNATVTVGNFIDSMDREGYKPEIHDIVLKFGGKTLKVELCAQAWELLEKFVVNLKDYEDEITIVAP